jgi:tetratricopeptide (TPR) repeat protein
METNGQTKELRSNFVNYFSGFAKLHSSPTPEDYQALELEKDNVLSAIDLASGSGDWISVLSMRAALEEFLDVHGYWEDAIRTGKQALDAARELGNDAAVSQFAHNLGVIHYSRGESDEARRLYHESLEIEKKLGNQSGIAITLHQLGRLAEDEGNNVAAAQIFDEALDILEKLKSPDAEIARQSLERVKGKPS